MVALGGASRFEWGAIVRRNSVADPANDAGDYDRRILMVTLRRAIEATRPDLTAIVDRWERRADEGLPYGWLLRTCAEEVREALSVPTRPDLTMERLRAAIPDRPWTLFTSIAAWVCYACKAERYQLGMTPEDDREGHNKDCAWVKARAALDTCDQCPHPWSEHTRGGMCGGQGTPCYCVRIPEPLGTTPSEERT